MDDLVLTGLVALIGFYTVAAAGAAGFIAVLFLFWNAAVTGNWDVMILLVVVLAAAGSGYAATGYYLHATGRI